MFDVVGNRVEYHPIVTERMMDFYTDRWNPGVYLVEVLQGDKKATKKVLVY